MDGAALATEDGSETNNEILHNFVMRTNGGTGDFNGLGVGDDDFGDLGDAFWFDQDAPRRSNSTADLRRRLNSS